MQHCGAPLSCWMAAFLDAPSISKFFTPPPDCFFEALVFLLEALQKYVFPNYIPSQIYLITGKLRHVLNASHYYRISSSNMFAVYRWNVHNNYTTSYGFICQCPYSHTAPQRQTAVTADFLSQQLLLFAFAQDHSSPTATQKHNRCVVEWLRRCQA